MSGFQNPLPSQPVSVLTNSATLSPNNILRETRSCFAPHSTSGFTDIHSPQWPFFIQGESLGAGTPLASSWVMFTVLSASKLGPSEDTSALILFPQRLGDTDLALGPFLLPLETSGLGKNGGCLCVCNHQLTAGSADWRFSFNLLFNTLGCLFFLLATKFGIFAVFVSCWLVKG